MQLPDILYHVCRERDLASIRERGLDPAFSRSSLSAVFLASEKSVALNYVAFDPDEKWVLLSINALELDPASLGPDNYELRDLLQSLDEEELLEQGLFEGATWKDVSWQDSLRLCEQVACHAVIKPQAIVSAAKVNAQTYEIQEVMDGFPPPAPQDLSPSTP